MPAEPDTAQLWQASAHALSQQTPSTQKPLAQPVPLLQVIPFERTQAPVASQVPAHSGSLAEMMGAQLPSLPGRLQARQVPLQTSPQQTPSAQVPLAHWLE